ncbi:MAG: hypothetical protein NT133_07865 [Alphaproteobacteria bacterium]|nr:hypothetical protein [Alphaproteobacteria bacterium]
MDRTLKYTPSSPAEARQRRSVAMRLQEIEGNPFTPEEVAMFEMFDREGWSSDKRREYLLGVARPAGVPHAAE